MSSVIEDIADGGVTTPKGFTASAVSCGIKKVDSDKLDLAMVYTPHSTVAAATFTSNRVKAAPVKVSQAHIAQDEIRAIIVNSGNANACTGEQGMADATEMTERTAQALGLRPTQVFVCSTGVIGRPMPMDRLRPHFETLAKTLADDSLRPAQAIMTSDTQMKRRAVQLAIGGVSVRIGAMAKGAGMICPNMATMLCFVTTDAAIDKACLESLTKRAVEQSFNRITVDGDMSTNDTVLVLANGQAGNAPIQLGSPEAEAFYTALYAVLLTLAKMIVRDAEKATRYIELTVKGARSEAEAHQVAKAVSNSVLVKCAWNGGQPYWGRIMHAIGYAGVEIDEAIIDIDFDGLAATRGGIASGEDLKALAEITQRAEFPITVDLHQGEASCTVYTSDISRQFVDFNLLD